MMGRGREWTGTMLAVIALDLIGSEASAKVVEYELTIDTNEVDFTGEPVEALTVIGGIPGPLLEFTEGDVVRIRVTNELDGPASVHWHGLLVPAQEDGVPYVSYPGIAPHGTFTYEFPIRQAGTYWYHSHTGFQEQRGVYGPIVIRPAGKEREPADLTIVAADGQDVEPLELDRLLISVAETYDVLVDVPETGSCELRATAQDGSGHVAGTIGKGERRNAPDVPFPDYYRNTMNAGYLKAMWRTAWDVAGASRPIRPMKPRRCAATTRCRAQRWLAAPCRARA